MPIFNVNNLNVYCDIYGQGEPIVLLHGLGSSTRDWENQVRFLAAHFKVIVFDLRGHGQTEKPDGPYSVSLLAKDTAALMQKILTEPATVIGHSLGGMIAFQLALEYPRLVKRLIIINSAPMVSFPSYIDAFKFYLRTLDVKLFGMNHISTVIAQLSFPNPHQEELRKLLISRWRENDPKAYLNSLAAFKGWSVVDRISSISCPTLVVTGDRDYTSVAFKEGYTKLMPNAELVVIKDSGHVTIIDQAEKLNEVILEFMKKSASS